jgi:Ca-activated chloride channel homolog
MEALMYRYLALTIAVLFSFPALAQRVPPPALMVQEEESSKPLKISSVDVDVRIVGFVAETRMTMVFYNPHDRVMAGDLYFPLPQGATVSGYALDLEGRMVDGVVVEKDKARQVFEIEVRKGVDPGLVEWVKGNNFKTRVYPIPAHGTRTIMVRYMTELVRDKAGPNYHLPLNFREPVDDFKLRVEVVKPLAPPKIKGGELANFSFKSWRESFVAETKLEKQSLVQDLMVAVPDTRPAEVRVEKAPDGMHYFYVRQQRPQLLGATIGQTPKVAILWDASGSRGNVDHKKEFELLQAFFKRFPDDSVDVTLSLFRNVIEKPRPFKVTSGDCSKLINALENVDYDGGTQMGALAPLTSKKPPSFYLLFSDGLSTFGKEEPPPFNAPIFTINGAQSANHSFLRFIALKSGGSYINLTRQEIRTAAGLLGQAPWSFVKAEVLSGKITDIFPSVPQPMPPEFFMVGKLESDTAKVRLSFGPGGKAQDTYEFTVARKEAVEQSVLRIFWAQKKVEELMIFPERNADELVLTGQEYGLVTAGTSLMVLERLDQYVEHRIAPPESLPEMRKEYFEQVEEFHRQQAADEEDKIQHVLELWQARVEWWNTKFKYPKKLRLTEEGEEAVEEGADEDGVVQTLSGGMGGGGAGPPGDVISGGSAGRGTVGVRLASPRAAASERAEDSRERSVSKKKSKNGNGGTSHEPPPPPPPEITIKEWNPDTPYLKALKKAGKGKQFDVYMGQRKEFGTSPAFYLDCADYFYRNKNETLALQVLSNIVELELENPALYRVVAHKLAQKGQLDLARQLFEKVLKLRPEEPQSYRDLALVLDQLKKFNRAVELLYHVVLNEWDRFEEIEVISLMELNRVLVRAKREKAEVPKVDDRLVKLLDVDARIIMTWDTDMTDMDLWVTEPSGEKANYSNNRTTIGGLVSRDFTNGYGPEEYVLKKAMRGKYKIEANYYGSSAPSLTGAVTLQVDVFTNYGRKDEKRQTLTIRLTTGKDEIHVGDISF